jgi:hypothetical protein
LEKNRIPTTTVCTTSFASLLKVTAKAKGLTDMSLVVVEHPIAVNDDDAIRKKADDAVEDLVRSLVTSS